jgi:hypothetical protein
MICASWSPPTLGQFRVRFRFARSVFFVLAVVHVGPISSVEPHSSMTETAQAQQPDATAQPLECSPQGYRSFHTPGMNFEVLFYAQVVGDPATGPTSKST